MWCLHTEAAKTSGPRSACHARWVSPVSSPIQAVPVGGARESPRTAILRKASGNAKRLFGFAGRAPGKRLDFSSCESDSPGKWPSAEARRVQGLSSRRPALPRPVFPKAPAGTSGRWTRPNQEELATQATLPPRHHHASWAHLRGTLERPRGLLSFRAPGRISWHHVFRIP